MNSKRTAAQAASAPDAAFPFTPVPVRPRHDGWTPGKQVAFIHALAETACVDEACRRVGMSQQSAYALRTRQDAVSFRQAWVVALDHGTARLTDKAMARAMNGVAVPIFYKGEKVGEKRVFNERLTMFLLRAHAPERYGAWRDAVVQTREHPDGMAELFKQAVRAVAEDALADQAGQPRPKRDLLRPFKPIDDGSGQREDRYAELTSYYRKRFEEQEREIEDLHARLHADGAPGGSAGNGG